MGIFLVCRMPQPYGGLDLLLGDVHALASLEHFPVFGYEELRLFAWKEIVIAATQQLVPREAQQLLARLVDPLESQALRLLDKEHDGHVFDDLVQKCVDRVQNAFLFDQRLLRALELRSRPPQTAKDLSQTHEPGSRKSDTQPQRQAERPLEIGIGGRDLIVQRTDDLDNAPHIAHLPIRFRASRMLVVTLDAAFLHHIGHGHAHGRTAAIVLEAMDGSTGIERQLAQSLGFEGVFARFRFTPPGKGMLAQQPDVRTGPLLIEAVAQQHGQGCGKRDGTTVQFIVVRGFDGVVSDSVDHFAGVHLTQLANQVQLQVGPLLGHLLVQLARVDMGLIEHPDQSQDAGEEQEHQNDDASFPPQGIPCRSGPIARRRARPRRLRG